MNLWLIGFRAAGKTTLGRLLAQDLGWQFLDLDEEFEKRQGVTILTFVERYGLDRFRIEETELLRELSAEPLSAHVIATGGGCVESEAARNILLASPWTKAWLDPPAVCLWARLEKEADRRKIGNLESFEAMQNILEKRRPFYEKIATFRIRSQDISESVALLKGFVGKL